MEIDQIKLENGFNFLPSFYAAARKLKKAADQAAFYNAVCEYMCEGKIPVFGASSVVGSLWELVYPILRNSKKKSLAGKSKSKSNDNQNESEPNQNESEPNQNNIKAEHSPSLRIKDKGKRKKEKKEKKEKPDCSALMPELPVFCPRCKKPTIRDGDRAVCFDCSLFIYADGSVEPFAASAKEFV